MRLPSPLARVRDRKAKTARNVILDAQFRANPRHFRVGEAAPWWTGTAGTQAGLSEGLLRSAFYGFPGKLKGLHF